MNPKQQVERDLEVRPREQIKMIENSHHKDRAVLAQKIDLMNLQLAEARHREKSLKVSYFELLEKYHQDSRAEQDSTSVVLLNILKKHLLLDSDKSSLPSSILQAFEKDRLGIGFEPARAGAAASQQLPSEVDKDESLLAFIEQRKASKDLSEASKEPTLRSSRSVADLKVKEVLRRGSNAVMSRYFDKKAADSLFGTQERFETQANELHTFKKSHQSSLSRIHPLCSRKNPLKQSEDDPKEPRYNTFQNDSSFTPCRNLFGDSLHHTASNLKPYTNSVDKQTTGHTGCAPSKPTSSKRKLATSSMSFKNLLSPKVFQTNSSTDKRELTQTIESEAGERHPHSTLQVKPSLIGNAFSQRTSQNTSKLSAFVQREMAKRDLLKEAKTKPSSPARMPRRGSRDSQQVAKLSSKLNSANSLKIPNINIHLTPNDRDVEAIEIDASVPDKCLIKFQRSATIKEPSPEPGPFGKPSRNLKAQTRNYLLNLENQDLLKNSMASKVFESNASLAADGNCSRVLRTRDSNQSAAPLVVYSQRRDTLSALRKTQSRGLLAHYDSAISKEEVKQRKESLADIESTQRQLTQELHKLTSIYQSHKQL